MIRESSLMIHLPPWAKSSLNEKKCPHCDCKTHIDCVVGIGVRQKDFSENNPSKNSFVLTFDYACNNCLKKSLWVIDPNDENLDLIDMLEQIKNAYINSQTENKKIENDKNVKSKISDKEIMYLKIALNNAKYYEDILKYLGVNIEKDNNE